MSLLGKILAILNILAVFGTLAVMGMFYGQRLAWEHAVYRQDLMLKGLPVSDKETGPMQQLSVDLLDEPTQKALFGGTNPVKTQEEEVKRIKGLLDSKISSAGDKKRQIVVLARILTPMSVTREQWEQMIAYQTYLGDKDAYQRLQERLGQADAAAKQAAKQARPIPYEQAFNEALGAQFSDPPGVLGEEVLAILKANQNLKPEQALEQSLDKHLSQLSTQYNQMFNDVLTAGNAEKTNNAAANSHHRRVVARLLFNMVEPLLEGQAAGNLDLMGNPAYKRFIMVVGVQAAVEAVNDQAMVLQNIADEVALERPKERSLFAVEHRKELDLVMEKRAELERHQALLARKQKESASHADNLRKRRLDVDYYQKQLAEARSETAKDLKQLRGMSDALHEESIKLRDNTAANQKLEKEIRTLETGR